MTKLSNRQEVSSSCVVYLVLDRSEIHYVHIFLLLYKVLPKMLFCPVCDFFLSIYIGSSPPRLIFFKKRVLREESSRAAVLGARSLVLSTVFFLLPSSIFLSQ